MNALLDHVEKQRVGAMQALSILEAIEALNEAKASTKVIGNLLAVAFDLVQDVKEGLEAKNLPTGGAA